MAFWLGNVRETRFPLAPTLPLRRALPMTWRPVLIGRQRRRKTIRLLTCPANGCSTGRFGAPSCRGRGFCSFACRVPGPGLARPCRRNGRRGRLARCAAVAAAAVVASGSDRTTSRPGCLRGRARGPSGARRAPAARDRPSRPSPPGRATEAVEGRAESPRPSWALPFHS